MRPTDLTWAGGEHGFLLTIDLLRALQEKCDAGPEWIHHRLSSGRWMVDDVIQPIRLGLEGGGLKKDEARKLVAKFVEDRPITESVLTAKAVLAAVLYGVEDDPVGESEAGEADRNATLSREESGASPTFTDGPASSAGTSDQ
ncbi:MAG: gene transfer agent family protein [Rhizobiaceae bacterium]|nr:gene transfer agent family protein [Rhizobiaceae bacterium]MCV0406323.1 gene transfer agent family protein [Rhizobiaceae bacterium]